MRLLLSDVSLNTAYARAEAMLAEPDMETPFLHRVARHMDIDDDCREYIRGLQSAPMVYPAGEEITRADSGDDQIYIVQLGWLISYSFTPSGQRFINRVYQPGDFIGIEDINWSYRTATVSCVTPCVLTAFTKPRLRKIFHESPRLSRTIFSIVAMTQVQGYDLQRAVSRLPADARLADFLLQMHSRAKAANTLVRDDELFLPLTQTEIGDAIGLTNVSVSRAFTGFESRGLVTRHGRNIRFLDIEAMRKLADFTDRHAEIDREWIDDEAAEDA